MYITDTFISIYKYIDICIIHIMCNSVRFCCFAVG